MPIDHQMIRSIVLLTLLISPCWAAGQGTVIWASDGARVTVNGQFSYDDAGWGWCKDSGLPSIENVHDANGWTTVIDCHGSGDNLGVLGNKKSTGCDTSPDFDFLPGPSLPFRWQIHVYCVKPALQS